MRKNIIDELKYLSTNLKHVVEDCAVFSKNIATQIKHHKHIFLLG